MAAQFDITNISNKMNHDDSGKKKKSLSTTQIILLGFFTTIMAGTLLLMLPIATVAGESTSFVDALFTATTSVCVTGLVVVDTFAHWTLFGKIIILLLIQVGGLGIVTLTSGLMLMLHRKVTLSDRMLIQDAFNLDTLQGLIRFIKKAVAGTFLIEGIGAFFYMLVFIPEFGVKKGMFVSIFNSVSAFCNAGIDIIGPTSLTEYYNQPIVNIVTMLLIVLGGIGYVVWFDFVLTTKKVIQKRYRITSIFKRLNEHSKLVLITTFILIFTGAVCIFLFEYSNPDTIGSMSLGNKIMNSFFQSVTLRTAGFFTIPQQKLTDPSFVICVIMMFIGGSPVGTAGGVKTVTIAVAVANVRAFIKDKDETVLFKRKVSHALINKALAVISFSFMLTLTLLMLLILTNPLEIKNAVFEIFSATATVGLSRNTTASLNTVGRLIIIAAMYLGRVGPISMAIAFRSKNQLKGGISHAEGHFIVG